MELDPFEEVARDLERLRNLSNQEDIDAKEEVRLLRLELNRRDASEKHLQQLNVYLKKQETSLKEQLEQLENRAHRQQIEMELREQQQQVHIGSSTEMLALVKSKWEEVKQHQNIVTEQRIKLEEQVEQLNVREQQLQEWEGSTDDRSIRRVKAELAQLRKDHAKAKERNKLLIDENNGLKSKLDRSKQRILSLKESNDVLLEERHRLMAALAPKESRGVNGGMMRGIMGGASKSTSNKDKNVNDKPGAELLKKIKQSESKYPHDRHQIVQEVDIDGFNSMFGSGNNSCSSDDNDSLNYRESKKRGGNGSNEIVDFTNDNDLDSEKDRYFHNKKNVTKHIKEIQNEYKNQLDAAKKKFESEAAKALMASENSMREEYRLEISLYQERERAAREEMVKLRDTVRLLLSKKKRDKRKQRKKKIEEEDTF